MFDRRKSNRSRGRGIAAVALALLAAASCQSEPPREAPGPGTRETGGPTPEQIRFATDISKIPTRDPLVERLLIFAVDGASWDVVDPLLSAGRLPNLQRLIAAGVRAELTTLEPTVSPAIWTTIATGVLPARHGILGFDGVPGVSMKTLPNSRMRKIKAYWNVLSDFGITSGTVGWWATWPAEPLTPGSFLVSDRVPYTRMEAAVKRASVGPDDTYPPELLESVAPLVERPNEIDPAAARAFLKMDARQIETQLLAAPYEMGSYLPEFKFVYQSDRSTLKMALQLLAERPVRVAAIYFTGIDTVSHLYWHFTNPGQFPAQKIAPEQIEQFGDVIALYYELMDRYLGELIEAAGGATTVMVLSDHGFGATGKLPWSGGHGKLTPGAPIAPPGILVLSGPGIRPGGEQLAKAHVLDIAPTILYLMGLPASEEMLGYPLATAFADGLPEELPRVESFERIGAPRPSGPPPTDPAGDAERMERLKALGYIQ